MDDPYYRTGTYLRAKHQQTRLESGRSFHAWALSLVPLSAAMRVLDAGCGWGRFTWQLVDTGSVPATHIIGSDRSPTMLGTALDEAHQRRLSFKVCAADIEALPFQGEMFDLVMANHVLYHLANLTAGLRELARVMKLAGHLLATTNSEAIRVTLIELHYQALEILGIPYEPEPPSPFSMENGEEQLAQVFREVNPFYFTDASVYPDAESFTNLYLTTGRYRNLLEREDISQAQKKSLPGLYRELVQDIITREGQLTVPVLMGAFVCTGPGL